MPAYGSTTASPVVGAQPQSQQQQDAEQAGHKRVYQACIPCRRRKVRCDLGSVDNPHDPPCVRCRRESKECFFSATRRKRKNDDDAGSDVDEYIIRNGRKRPRASLSPAPPVWTAPDRRSAYSDTPLTPGGSHGRAQPLRRPDERHRGSSAGNATGDFGGSDGDANQTLENLEAQAVMRRGMYGPHDALDLLYKAATDRFVAEPPRVSDFAYLSSPHNIREENRAPTASTQPPPHSAKRHVPRPTVMSMKMEDPVVDPELSQPDPASQPGYEDAIKIWARFRFVRAGWFTSQEAIEYID